MELFTALHTLFDVDVVRSTGKVDGIGFDETSADKDYSTMVSYRSFQCSSSPRPEKFNQFNTN